MEPNMQGLIFSREAFPVNPRVVPGGEQARAMTVGSGRRCLESLGMRNRNGSLARMLAVSLLLKMDWYSSICWLTWKTRVTKFNRLLFQLAPSTPRTEGIESGLLHTPNAADGMQGEIPATAFQVRGTIRKVDNSGNSRALGLARQIVMLKIPTTTETEGGVMELREGANAHYKLRDQIAGLMATPTVGVHPNSKRSEAFRKGRAPNAVEVCGANTGLRLQPAFVEWMMGYPPSWTELPESKLSATPSSLKLLTKS